MTEKIANKTVDENRALYGVEHVIAENCKFEGDNAESALKECGVVEAKDCRFDSSYPLWHGRVITLEDCEFTAKCRAALWYSQNIGLVNTKLHGTKALRECKNTVIRDCDIDSSEFGWSLNGVRLTDSTASGEYFLARSKNLAIRRLSFKGKYCMQYIKDAIIIDCTLNTTAALWHSKNVTLENCVIVGEYLGWYSKNLTFKNCTIIGTKPLCYCKNVKLVDCIMQDVDCAFERSEVYAVLRGKIDSILNPTKGVVKAPEVGSIIRTDPYARCKVLIDPYLLRGFRND
ncbi:MAG: DUF3737 family protein [Clostridiales bacterium]|nr:DUF3737 family protein [Clostridiales bacterium]